MSCKRLSAWVRWVTWSKQRPRANCYLLWKPLSWKSSLSAADSRYAPSAILRRKTASSTLGSKVDTSCVTGRLASCDSSVPGVVKSEEPQSRHTNSFGNTKTPGLSIFSRPWKWILISAVNSAWLAEAQSGHIIRHPSCTIFEQIRKSLSVQYCTPLQILSHERLP